MLKFAKRMFFTYWIVAVECGNVVSAGERARLSSVGSATVRILVRVLPGCERGSGAGELELRPADLLRLGDVVFLFPVVSEETILADHEGVQDGHYEDGGDPRYPHDYSHSQTRT